MKTKENEVNNKKGKKAIIIILILILIAAVAVLAGYFIMKNKEENKSVGTMWGDTYYKYLKDSQESEEITTGNLLDIVLQFIQIYDDQDPAMVMTYEKDNLKHMTIYELDETQNVTKTTHVAENKNDSLDVKLLYNIKDEDYKWYKYTKNEEGTQTYFDLEDESEYTFTKDEIESENNEEKIVPKISKFEENFVVPEETKESEKVKVEDIKEIKEIKEKIVNAVEKYKDKKQTVTDETKVKVDEKLTQIKDKKEKIKNSVLDSSKKIVYSAYEKSFASQGETVKVSIPAINIKDEKIKNINDEIMSKYQKNISQNEECAKTQVLGLTKITYKYYQNGDIVSIIIQTDMTNMSYTSYEVYNVDITTGKKLEKEQVLATKNITKEQYEETIANQIKAAFEKMWSVESGQEFYNQTKQKNDSKTNCSLEKTNVFLKEDGKLAYIGNVYSLAGAGLYEYVFDYETGNYETKK